MLSPEEQQMQICLIKSNLDEIENQLVCQSSEIPYLDEENEQQYSETKNALQVARALNAQLEKLNLQNVKLFAKRMEVKRQCDEVAKALESAVETRHSYIALLDQEEKEHEQLVTQYEDTLREKTDKFRKSHIYYNTDAMQIKIQNTNEMYANLEDEMRNVQCRVEVLRRELQTLSIGIPENILDIVGKRELDEKLQQVIHEYDELLRKENTLR